MSSSCCEDVTRPALLPKGVTLRLMKSSDLPQVRMLHRNLLPVSYPAAFFIQLLVNSRRLCLVATDHGAIVGFASAAMGLLQPSSLGERLRDIPANQECFESCSDIPRSHITLLTLGVLPAYQRRGIGRSLVHGVVQRLEALCTADSHLYDPVSSDHILGQDHKTAVLVQVQVAPSNLAGKRFYTNLGMIDQHGCDEPRLNVGLRSRTSVMAGVMCV